MCDSISEQYQQMFRASGGQIRNQEFVLWTALILDNGKLKSQYKK